MNFIENEEVIADNYVDIIASALPGGDDDDLEGDWDDEEDEDFDDQVDFEQDLHEINLEDEIIDPDDDEDDHMPNGDDL